MSFSGGHAVPEWRHMDSIHVPALSFHPEMVMIHMAWWQLKPRGGQFNGLLSEGLRAYLAQASDHSSELPAQSHRETKTNPESCP